MLIDLKNKFSDPSKKLSTKLEPVLNAVLVAVWCLRMPDSSHVSCKSCVQLRSVQLLNYLRFIYFIFFRDTSLLLLDILNVFKG